SLLPGAVGVHPAAVRGIRGPALAARADPVLHGLRRGARTPDRRVGARRAGWAGPGGPGAARPSQPGARRAVPDELRHPPGRDEAPRGAPQGAAVRGARVDDEAAALGSRTALARGDRAGRHGAAAHGPDPGVPRT